VYSLDLTWRNSYAQELNLTSMKHLKIMLRQMLTTEQVPNIREWEETLLKLALRIARELTFTTHPHRQGEDMDVRRYVKIKKIPGGMPTDSEYVDGAVITKNVAHKQMSRVQRNPRVMLVTFPLEFYRVEGQYMHFGQIVRQEKEYLGNLATRIAALRPHVVLVEKSVSRLALDALAKHNIAVARTVKPSAIQFVARMTQGDVFSSMDKLALEPRLGHCGRYRIQTYDHPLIPGRRKTYMRFEGCSRDMGCTIILRGGDIDTLKRIKKVTRFLTFIVRNLKLETHLWKDSVITLPGFNAFAIPAVSTSKDFEQRSSTPGLPSTLSGLPTTLTLPGSMSTLRFAAPLSDVTSDIAEPLSVGKDDADIDEDLPDEDAEQLRLSRRINQSLEPYTKTFISVSATLRFPAPQPVRRMMELDNELIQVKRAWEDEVVRREEKLHSRHVQEATVTTPNPAQITTSVPPVTDEQTHQDHNDISALIDALPAADIPRTPASRESTLLSSDGTDYFSSTAASNSNSRLILSSPPLSSSPPPEELQVLPKTVEDIALESRLSLVQWQHEEQRRIWEWYLRKNSDDFVVEKYQCISLWEYTIPTAEVGLHRSCFAPLLKYITFYGENDCTLGQYIEKSVGDTLVQFLDPKAICAGKVCNQPLARHCRVYVHNETRLFVAVEQWDGQIIGRGNYSPSPDLITTWSACRVCGSATPFIPVSEEMQRYSFAKFLELHFYPADVKLVQGAGCQHNIYQHHVRFFASKGMTVRFQTDPVVLHDVVYPPMRIRVRPESQLELKNADFERLHRRNLLWYTALVDDLKLISIDAATGDEVADAKLTADINLLISRAECEREEISRLINKIYKESASTDTLALNQVRSQRQDKIVEWQLDFDRLPKPRPITAVDRNIRKSSAFGSVRAMFPRRHDVESAFDLPNVASASVSEVEEVLSKMRRVTGESFASSASETSETESAGVHARSAKTEVASSGTEPLPVTEEDGIAPVNNPKSDPDSDSTIGAARDEAASPSQVPLSPTSVSDIFPVQCCY
jgi:1-phosphatidylinositol-3-phosphate 5-kinase